MLHPVGDLPAAVYWRRRLVVLAVLVALLAAAGWLVVSLVRGAGGGAAPEDEASAGDPAPTPALERVLPSLAGVRTPEHPPATPLAEERPEPPTRRTAAAPAPGSRCTDDMIEVAVRAPARVPAGSAPTFEIVVRNVAGVPCVRDVDAELQEIQLFDAAGTRVWGSNDCLRETSDRRVTLRPRTSVTLPIAWTGLTSAPGCAERRVAPAAGDYLLRARLGTKTSADVPLRIGQL